MSPVNTTSRLFYGTQPLHYPQCNLATNKCHWRQLDTLHTASSRANKRLLCYFYHICSCIPRDLSTHFNPELPFATPWSLCTLIVFVHTARWKKKKCMKTKITISSEKYKVVQMTVNMMALASSHRPLFSIPLLKSVFLIRYIAIQGVPSQGLVSTRSFNGLREREKKKKTQRNDIYEYEFE